MRMCLYKYVILVTFSVCITQITATEEIRHIYSKNGRNVHVHLHEVGACSEKPQQHHHHQDDHEDGSHVGHVDAKDKQPKQHNGIHIHVHEAGDNCTNHGAQGGHSEFLHPDNHHDRGTGARSCAMCARSLGGHSELSTGGFGHHGQLSHTDGGKQDHADNYVYAHCEMSYNKAADKKDRVKIKGAVHMRQSMFGGPVEMMLDLKGFRVHKGDMQHVHGFHVHEFGDLSDGCQSTGGHFNPFGMEHGAPDNKIRHAGDYGNIECDQAGNVKVTKYDIRSTLIGYHNIIGRAIVIHEKADDLGLGGVPASKKTGDAGSRLACCIIVRTKPHGDWSSHEHEDFVQGGSDNTAHGHGAMKKKQKKKERKSKAKQNAMH